MAETPEEKLKREQEESRQRTRAILDELMAAKSPQVEQSYLSPEEITDYKTRFRDNLNRRDDATKYLMGLLFNKTPDPTAPGDPSRDIIFERDPNRMADEMKAADRRGKSKVGNFFRNIDYFLGDGRTRDLKIAGDRQKEAMIQLGDLLREQGTELTRGMNANNFLSNANTRNNQNATKIAIGAEQKMNDSANKSANDMFKQLMESQKFASQDALRQSQIGVNTARKKQLEDFAPYGRAGSKEQQDAMQIIKFRQEGKNDLADQLQAEMRRAHGERLGGQALLNALRGGGGSISETLIQGVDPATGNKTIMKFPKVTRQLNPLRDAILQGQNPFETFGVKIPGLGSSQNSNETGPKIPVSQRPVAPTKAAKIVSTAMGKAQDEAQKQFIATQALTEGLNKSQVESDASRARLGHRYTLDNAPTNPNAIDTGLKPSGNVKDVKDFTKFDSEINTAARAFMSAAAKGTHKKVYGWQNNKLTAINDLADSVLPGAFGSKIASKSTDPTFEVNRIFPDKTGDKEKDSFNIASRQLVNKVLAATQLDETGKVVNEREMNNILQRLPRPTDEPSIALEKMLNFTISARVSSYLAAKGYNKTQIQKVNGYLGDYLSPRVKQIRDQIENAPAQYANHKVSSHDEAINDIDFLDLDPEALIGDALYRYVKSKPGASLKDIEKDTGVRIRRLIPDDDSPQAPPNQDREFLDNLRKMRSLPRRK